MSKFEWPCDKRTAHGPHEVRNTIALTDDQLVDAIDLGVTHPACPGVKAHPSTMIGRP